MAGSISATTAALISAAVGAAGVGAGLYESNDASINQRAAQQQQQDALLKQQQAQANQANLTKQEAILGAQGQSQQQTGGNLTDEGTAALTSLLAGYPGYQAGGSGAGATPNAGTSVGTGVGTSGVPGSGASGTPDIATILAALRSGMNNGTLGVGTGTISGGNWQTQPEAPQGAFQLANPVLS